MATPFEHWAAKAHVVCVVLWFVGMGVLLGTDIAGPRTRHMLWAALGVLVFVFALISLYASRSGKRVVRTLDLRICPECSFDLRHLPDNGRCPECGTGYSEFSLRAQWRETYPDL